MKLLKEEKARMEMEFKMSKVMKECDSIVVMCNLTDVKRVISPVSSHSDLIMEIENKFQSKGGEKPKLLNLVDKHTNVAIASNIEFIYAYKKAKDYGGEVFLTANLKMSDGRKRKADEDIEECRPSKKQMNTGRWSTGEKGLYEEAIKKFGVADSKNIATYIGTRDAKQVQKFKESTQAKDINYGLLDESVMFSQAVIGMAKAVEIASRVQNDQER